MINATYLAEAKPINKQALVGIYEQHSPGIYRFAYRQLGDRGLAEECVSETFSRFLHAMRQGRAPIENVTGYLYRIAQNCIVDHYRRKPRAPLPLEADDHPDPGGDPERAALQQLEEARVRAALQRLPDDQRRVVLLRILEGWSHEQVAEALGKSIEATRALQYRALTALRRMLIEKEEGDRNV
ncbi:MAG: RNA polymerase sigma factor [Omnitrophica WOR_2 bacterium]